VFVPLLGDRTINTPEMQQGSPYNMNDVNSGVDVDMKGTVTELNCDGSLVGAFSLLQEQQSERQRLAFDQDMVQCEPTSFDNEMEVLRLQNQILQYQLMLAQQPKGDVPDEQVSSGQTSNWVPSGQATNRPTIGPSTSKGSECDSFGINNWESHVHRTSMENTLEDSLNMLDELHTTHFGQNFCFKPKFDIPVNQKGFNIEDNNSSAQTVASAASTVATMQEHQYFNSIPDAAELATTIFESLTSMASKLSITAGNWKALNTNLASNNHNSTFGTTDGTSRSSEDLIRPLKLHGLASDLWAIHSLSDVKVNGSPRPSLGNSVHKQFSYGVPDGGMDFKGQVYVHLSTAYSASTISDTSVATRNSTGVHQINHDFHRPVQQRSPVQDPNKLYNACGKKNSLLEQFLLQRDGNNRVRGYCNSDVTSVQSIFVARSA
jgi:hypothetical protein